jgi:hypothetical protein
VAISVFSFCLVCFVVLGFREPGIFALDDLALLLGFLLIAGVLEGL